MKHLKQHWSKLLAAALVLAVLAAAFYFGGNAPNLRGWKTTSSTQTEEKQSAKSTADSAQKTAAGTAKGSAAKTASTAAKATPKTAAKAGIMKINPKTGKDRYQTTPVPKGKPAPKELQNTSVTDTTCSCTLSVSCSEALKAGTGLSEEKRKLLPEDGWILKPVRVSFQEGENVFTVLKRVCREKKIPMEFSEEPLYNTAYLEGIDNLYEFDCGELSGWMYSVNGWQPNYGASRYALKDGDTVCWSYTCDRTSAAAK